MTVLDRDVTLPARHRESNGYICLQTAILFILFVIEAAY